VDETKEKRSATGTVSAGRIRDLARSASGGDRGARQRAFRDLLEAVFELLHEETALATPWLPDDEHARIVVEFIEAKFLSEDGRRDCTGDLLKCLAEAAQNPRGLLRVAARNFALDWTRQHEAPAEWTAKPIDLERTPQPSCGDYEGEGLATASPIPEADGMVYSWQACDLEVPQAESGDDESVQSSAIRDVRQRIESLPREQRLLLAVYLSEALFLGDEDLAFLAERRGVPREHVVAEIEHRLQRQTGRREETLTSLSGARERYWNVCHRVDRFQALVRGMDGGPTTLAIPLDPARRDALLRSVSEARRASPSERTAALSYLLDRRQKLARRITDLQEALRRHCPDGPNHEEIATILGRLPSGADEAQRRTVVNSVTVAIKRLLVKLSARNDGEQA
jgi:hypothetical protein